MNSTTTAGPMAGAAKAKAKAARPRAADLRRSPARGTVLGIGVTQLVTWQLAAAAVWLAAAAGPRWALAVTAALAAGAVTLTTVRRQESWLYQAAGRGIGRLWRPGRRRGRRRGREIDRPEHEPELATVRALLPELRLGTIPGRRGRTIGVIRDCGGWAAVIGLRGGDEVLPARPVTPLVPLGRLAAVLTGDDLRPVAVQVVQHVVPAAGPCPVPVARATWIVLRMDPSGHPSALAGDGGADVLGHALRRVVERTAEMLAAAGLAVEVLDEAGLRSALGMSSASTVAAGSVSRAVEERRQGWSGGGAAHVGYWIRDWPGDGVPAVLGVATGLRASAVSMSITLRHQNGRSGMCGLVRISGRTLAEARRAGDRLADRMAAAGARLVRLDGRHAAALVATLPLGLGVR